MLVQCALLGFWVSNSVVLFWNHISRSTCFWLDTLYDSCSMAAVLTGEHFIERTNLIHYYLKEHFDIAYYCVAAVHVNLVDVSLQWLSDQKESRKEHSARCQEWDNIVPRSIVKLAWCNKGKKEYIMVSVEIQFCSQSLNEKLPLSQNYVTSEGPVSHNVEYHQ